MYLKFKAKDGEHTCFVRDIIHKEDQVEIKCDFGYTVLVPHNLKLGLDQRLLIFEDEVLISVPQDSDCEILHYGDKI